MKERSRDEMGKGGQEEEVFCLEPLLLLVTLAFIKCVRSAIRVTRKSGWRG